ncbi:MAG: L-threonylcarbamoyladenylate synthase, partial [Verrucomicrobiota bacterium]|nr:L-threonylcarbamoyladenylate synthase [Verrucomicrobiota bacterium]
NGEIVALPTETVYGLAADALNPAAVVNIFEAKERPRFDPLIVHLPDNDWFEQVVDLSTQNRQFVFKLIDRFWPGPFTVVLPRKPIVPEIVTAGLDTVAVRISAHPIFAGVIREFGKPLAAPSANRFGKISPTTAEHVVDELDGRIPLIVDGGSTPHGIESTIVAVRAGKIEILRRGPISEEELSSFGRIDIVDVRAKINAPGQLPTHYAPKTRLQLIDETKSFSAPEKQRCGLLAWNPVEKPERFAAIRRLSDRSDLREAAANLFRYLRELDALDVDLILAERVPDRGLGAAILDRLRRASHHSDAPGRPQ